MKRIAACFVALAFVFAVIGCSIPRIPDKQVRYFEKNTDKKLIEKKSRVLSTVLNVVIPGTGQMYCEDWGDGVLTFFTSWLVVPYFFGIADANLTAKYLNYEHSYNEYNPEKE